MGYWIETIRSDFRIADEVGALVVLHALGNGNGHPQARSGGCFMWMHDEDPASAASVHEALKMWMYDYDADKRTLTFTAEKAGDEEIMLAAIAPFVEAGSSVEMSGEDGYRWRWRFDGHRLINEPF